MKALGKSLEQDVLHEVAIALAYLTEFQNSTASDEDKKKYQAIEQAFAGVDLLYCELRGDVEEDAASIYELAEPFITKEQCDGNIVKIVENLCDILAIYKRTLDILDETEWKEQHRIHKAWNQAIAEIEKQKEDEDA